MVDRFTHLKARRDYSSNTTHRFIEVFDFKHFARHFTFDRAGENELNKELKSYVPVSVVLRVETGNTSKIN